MGSMSPPRAGSTAGTEAVKKERNGNPESLHQPNGRSADFLLLDVSSSFRNARQQALHRPGSGGWFLVFSFCFVKRMAPLGQEEIKDQVPSKLCFQKKAVREVELWSKGPQGHSCHKQVSVFTEVLPTGSWEGSAHSKMLSWAALLRSVQVGPVGGQQRWAPFLTQKLGLRKETSLGKRSMTHQTTGYYTITRTSHEKQNKYTPQMSSNC